MAAAPAIQVTMIRNGTSEAIPMKDSVPVFYESVIVGK